MRAAAAQPFPDRAAGGNPSTDPRLLATLAIPFLETYMAVHSETRLLLLECPPEHLATALALQELVGHGLMKTAGIILAANDDDNNNNNNNAQANNKNSSGFPGPRYPGGDAQTEMHTTPLSPRGWNPSRRPSSSPPSSPLSRADFVLASPATELETATFVAAVWGVLVDRSPFYIPDGAPSGAPPPPSAAARRSSSGGEGHAHGPPRRRRDRSLVAQSPLVGAPPKCPLLDSAAAAMGFQTPRPPLPLRRRRSREVAGPPGTPFRHKSVISSSSSVAGSISGGGGGGGGGGKTARMVRSQKAKLRSILGRELDEDEDEDEDKSSLRRDAASFFMPSDDDDSKGDIYYDDDDDDDDDDDNVGGGRFAADERRYIPLFVKRHEARKSNSRKALKFLGLSTDD